MQGGWGGRWRSDDDDDDGVWDDVCVLCVDLLANGEDEDGGDVRLHGLDMDIVIICRRSFLLDTLFLQFMARLWFKSHHSASGHE